MRMKNKMRFIFNFIVIANFGYTFFCFFTYILKDSSLTVKAVTLILISGRGSAISSAKKMEIRLFI